MMSNHLAIAATTSTFSQLLQKAASVVDEAKVTVGRPKDGTPTGINLFLYQVSPNAALRNADLPTRRPEGTLVNRPQAALDLHYLLTFYGAESKMEPQILMGNSVSILHARPILTQDMIKHEIERCVAEDSNHPLAKSDLADQVERIKFTPLPMSLEELSKLWSVFFQIPYTLSLAYQASVVLIEADIVPQKALPVRAANLYAITFHQPLIEKVEAKDGEDIPIVYNSTIIITGQRLKGDVTMVRLGEVEVTIPPNDPVNTISNTRIELSLGSALFAGTLLRAGIQRIQVLHPMMMGTPEVVHHGVESNVVPFVLHPTVTVDSVSSAAMTLNFSPKVGKTQRVIALLNQFNANTDNPRAYMLNAPSNNGITGENVADTAAITFSLADVKAGDYLLRVQVDGAESPLAIDPDPNNPRYISPRVNVP
jgi:hypothetical protein